MRPADSQPPTSLRLSVQEAADVLGITVDAIRGRVKRGTLESDKDEDGTVYVILEGTDQPNNSPRDESRLADDQPGLVANLGDQVAYLREQLAVWQEEARRKDHIIAALTERIPELPAPAPEGALGESRESSVSSSDPSAGGEVTPEPTQRSWWRKFFGIP
jgi:hypothetical protein